MNQTERRIYLIQGLCREDSRFADIRPEQMSEEEQKNTLRGLMNIRLPAPVGDEWLAVQDDYLQQAIAEKGITSLEQLVPVQDRLYLWQGDITTFACDAIVNAANSELLGCFVPLHHCIDNCIHSYAGLELRNCCERIMQQQGHSEPAGQAKITPAYNLPCRYVLHTVGPIVNGSLTERDCALLESCYLSCLKLAEKNGVQSLAFCCISTGVFGFPQQEAAEIAVRTVKDYLTRTDSRMCVIFNVFQEKDRQIYQSLLG